MVVVGQREKEEEEASFFRRRPPTTVDDRLKSKKRLFQPLWVAFGRCSLRSGPRERDRESTESARKEERKRLVRGEAFLFLPDESERISRRENKNGALHN